MHLLAFDTSTDALSVAVLRSSAPGSFTGLRTACSVAQGLAYGAGVPVLPVSSLLALAQSARAAHAPQASQGCVSALLDARMDEVYAATYAFAGDVWTLLQAPCLLAPEQVAAWAHSAASWAPGAGDTQPRQVPAWRAWTGNVFASYGERLAAPVGLFCCEALPQAMALLQVAPALIAAGGCVPPDQALPLYVRDKVAKTTGERALEKAHKAGLAPMEAAPAAAHMDPFARHAQESGS
jgi:tRNA threonylcarbamoyladenosine biosynthesis protein TsaB